MANVENGALQTAIDNAAVGETVMLTSDVTLTKRVTVSNVVTIDLNGYTITGNINDGYGTIYVGTKGILTIIDSSSGQIGGITNNVGNAIGNYGEVIVYGGTLVGNYALYNFYYSNSIYGKSVIYGGTFKSIDSDSPSIANCGNLTISGGTIESVDTTNVLTVASGTIESLYVGVADYNPSTQSTSVNGGHITNLTVADNSINNIVVSGGTFSTAIDSQYLADGIKLSYDAATGTYSTAVSQGLKVIATTSERIKDLVIKNGQLIFIQDLGRIAFDFKNKRKFYNQIEELDTELTRKELESPINGVYYFVIETAILWTYRNNEWVQITEKPQEIVFIGTEFPELGKEQTIYANTTDGEEHIAVWDEGKYKIVADKTQSMTSEDVIALFNN